MDGDPRLPELRDCPLRAQPSHDAARTEDALGPRRPLAVAHHRRLDGRRLRARGHRFLDTADRVLETAKIAQVT